MKTIGVYENFNIEYFEHDGEKYLQGILSTDKNQLFIVGGRYTNPSVRTQKFPSSSRSWLPRSTQILTPEMNWKNGPELPSPFIMPILHCSGDSIIVLDKSLDHAFKIDKLKGGVWLELPKPATRRHDFGSFVLKNVLYIIGGYINSKSGELFEDQPIRTCEYLDLQNPQNGWKTVTGGKRDLSSPLLPTNITLGSTFAAKIDEDCAIIGGLNTRNLFLFRDSKFSLLKGEDLQYDGFNCRHHKLVRWPEYD